jgi:predicted short-subunit dehydrogenase-like oxidoreductase (DUF2520 family)
VEIVIIGTGNTATVLGKKFKNAGHLILQVVGRNAFEAKKIAELWKTDFTNKWDVVNTGADVYIIAISDDAIGEVTNHLKLPGKVVAHTAASVPKEILKPVTDHYGVFYPLQSLRKEMTDLPDIPIFYDGSDDRTKKKLEKLAHSISGKKVAEANAETMQKLHVAAVIVNNFTNHLYDLAEEYCRKEGLDFSTLYPLIEETAARLKEVSPGKAQTGPAVRHDEETIQKHLNILDSHPDLKKLYEFLSESIATKKH